MDLATAVRRSEELMAHAWMVRAFVKHSAEVEEYPELMEIVRGVFDTARALETRIDDPPRYLQMLRKKVGKLRAAAAQFTHDAPLASDHTNFRQAVISINACVAEWNRLLELTHDEVNARRLAAPHVAEDESSDADGSATVEETKPESA